MDDAVGSPTNDPMNAAASETNSDSPRRSTRAFTSSGLPLLSPNSAFVAMATSSIFNLPSSFREGPPPTSYLHNPFDMDAIVPGEPYQPVAHLRHTNALLRMLKTATIAEDESTDFEYEQGGSGSHDANMDTVASGSGSAGATSVGASTGNNVRGKGNKRGRAPPSASFGLEAQDISPMNALTALEEAAANGTIARMMLDGASFAGMEMDQTEEGDAVGVEGGLGLDNTREGGSLGPPAKKAKIATPKQRSSTNKTAATTSTSSTSTRPVAKSATAKGKQRAVPSLPTDQDPDLSDSSNASALPPPVKSKKPRKSRAKVKPIPPSSLTDLDVALSSMAPIAVLETSTLASLIHSAVDSPDLFNSTAGFSPDVSQLPFPSKPVPAAPVRAQGPEKEAKKRKKIKRVITEPAVPAIFTDPRRMMPGEEGDELRELEKSERERGLDLETSEGFPETLNSFRQYYSAAYEALNLELIKVQIEASVLHGIKDTVLHERNGL